MRLWKVVHLIISGRQESGGFFCFFFANVNFMNGLLYVLIIQSRKQRDIFKNFIIIFFPEMGFYYLLAAYQKQTSPRGFGLNHSFVAMKCQADTNMKSGGIEASMKATNRYHGARNN